MLVIGHRGAAGLAPENTLEALQAGLDAGADILEFDIRATKDNVLVLVHDFHTLRTHHRASIISRMTFDELQSMSEDRPNVTRLDDVLDKYFGVILLNIEIKSRGSGEQLIALLKSATSKKPPTGTTSSSRRLKATNLSVYAGSQSAPILPYSTTKTLSYSWHIIASSSLLLSGSTGCT